MSKKKTGQSAVVNILLDILAQILVRKQNEPVQDK